MGKIRLKTLGDDELEQQQAVDAKKRREAKKEKKGEEVEMAAEAVVTPEAPVVEAAAATEMSEETQTEAPKEKGAKEKAKEKAAKKAEGAAKKSKTGKKALEARKKVDSSKKYAVADAVALVKTLTYVKFDETVELHMNMKELGVKGEVTLPHGTGKELKVAIADEKLLKDIEAGTFDFDILITTPAFMPKLVPFARTLGPKGLMPNPKNGTVSDKPEEAAKKFKGGNVRFKTEPKAPLIHQAVGKMSLTESQLVENIEALLGAVQKRNIMSAYVSGTMTPSVQLDLS
jgi:large subunit ribosomal protein L1